MSGIPPADKIPETVGGILVFMPNIDNAKKVIACLPGEDEIGNKLTVRAANTKQGRFMLNIEGKIPKDYALKILQTIDNLEGDIRVVAGK